MLIIFPNWPYTQKLNDYWEISLGLQDSEQAWRWAPPRRRTVASTVRRKHSWANQAGRPAGAMSLAQHFYTTCQRREKLKRGRLLPHWEALKIFQTTGWRTSLPNTSTFKCSRHFQSSAWGLWQMTFKPNLSLILNCPFSSNVCDKELTPEYLNRPITTR